MSFQNPLGKKIYKDSSEDMSTVNNSFDNPLDMSQVMEGMKMFQSGEILKVMKKCSSLSVMSPALRIANLSDTVITASST